MIADPYVPFCGTPPQPNDLWSRWMFEPLLLAGLLVALTALIVFQRHDAKTLTGWGVVVVLFVSPLCALSMALFSARVGQHLLLTLVAAPLMASALGAVRLPTPLLAGLFAVLFWVWHMPAPYAATLASDAVYWAMHLSLLGCAILLWAGLRTQIAARPMAAYLVIAATAAQMTLLSVLLTLSSTAWHDHHQLPAMAYGLTGLQDQILAGGLMWVAGSLLMMVLVWRLVALQLDYPDHAAASEYSRNSDHGILNRPRLREGRFTKR